MRSRVLILVAIVAVCVIGRGAYAVYLVHTDSGLDYIARPDEFQIRKAN